MPEEFRGYYTNIIHWWLDLLAAKVVVAVDVAGAAEVTKSLSFI